MHVRPALQRGLELRGPRLREPLHPRAAQRIGTPDLHARAAGQAEEPHAIVRPRSGMRALCRRWFVSFSMRGAAG